MDMTNNVEQSNWTEIKITVDAADIETAENIANMTVPYGIYTEDYSSLENDVMQIAHIDSIEKSLLEKDRSRGIIHIYINPDENPAESVSFIEQMLKNQNISCKTEILSCRTEDWQNNWKRYFHPMPVGEKLLIRPLWDNDFEANGRKVLNIEPGLAFGTGSHPTTRLCLETLEKYVNSDTTVLDVGCGSGILSIACLLLGAKSALGVDIDSIAVKTAVSNAAENGFYSPTFIALRGDLSKNVGGTYSLITANIVADIVIELNKDVGNLLSDNGVYITGGIIESREDEVLQSFEENSFEVIERHENDGWLVFALKKKSH